MAIIIKTREQIEGIRKSCKLASATLDYAQRLIEGGQRNTNEIDRLIECYIRENDAVPAPLNYMGFPKSSCISINEVVCHGIPNEDTNLKDGDIVNIDVTTILDGYYGDTSRMMRIGEISEDAERLLRVSKECLNLGISQVKPNNFFGMIGAAICRYAKDRGYSVVFQFCGHGTGVKFHEEPQINHHIDASDTHFHTKMEPGMIFTIEPMINEGVAEAVVDETDRWTARTKDGKLSAQYEHTMLVTENGVDVLT